MQTQKLIINLLMDIKRSDHTRGKYLADKKHAAAYHKRSSANWLSLSESKNLSTKERLICLVHATKNVPSIVFSRKFWFSLKKLFIDLVKTTMLFKMKLFKMKKETEYE